MADEDILLLLHFLFYRFTGVIPDDRMLLNGIADFERERGA